MSEVMYSFTIPHTVKLYNKKDTLSVDETVQRLYDIFNLLCEQHNNHQLALRIKEICKDDIHINIRLGSGTTHYECELIISRMTEICKLINPNMKVKWFKDPPVILKRTVYTKKDNALTDEFSFSPR